MESHTTRFAFFLAALAIAVTLAPARPARAQAPPVLVKDIDQQPVTYGVRPTAFPSTSPAIVDVGGTAFFAGCADDGTTGCELWKSDGTAAGTMLVKDIMPGIASSNPSYLVAVGEMLFFAACSAPGSSSSYPADCELWKSDGTEAGTVRVKDIVPGSDSSVPRYLTNVNGTLFFSADDGTAPGLWRSDGTAAGTVLVAGYAPPITVAWETGTLIGLTPYAGGTAIGTFALDAGEAEVPGVDYGGIDGNWTAEVCCGQQTGSFDSTFDSDGRVFGTVSGSYALAEPFPGPGTGVTISGPTTFSADPPLPDTLNGLRFEADLSVLVTLPDQYVFGGPFRFTASGYRPPGTLPESAQNLTNVGGTIFFTTSDQLWKSDGTTAGTVFVKNLHPSGGGGYSPNPTALTDVDGTLFFVMTTQTLGRELWKSDGTEAGTILVADIAAGGLYYYPAQLTPVSGTLFFVACSAGSYPEGDCELWKSDGTEAGTVRVKDIVPGSDSSVPSYLTNVNGTLFFEACSEYTYYHLDCELWKSDGTEEGTVRVKDIQPGSGSSVYGFLTNVNGILFFSAYNGTSGYELWKSDGTTAGTVLVKDIQPGGDSLPQSLANVNGTLFFVANDGTNGFQVWKSDGTTSGTVFVMEGTPPGTGSSSYRSLTAVDGTLFFVGPGGLWKSDGTEAGTVLVKNVYGYELTNVNGMLFFTDGLELWKSNGTEAGTTLVSILPGGGYRFLRWLTNVDGTLYLFSCVQDYYVGRCEFWKSDGTEAGTVAVTSAALISPFSWDPGHELPASATGVLFFAGWFEDGSCGIWKSDGTEAGTVLLKPSLSVIFPGNVILTDVGETLFFSVDGELWKSDGTAAGTVLVKAIGANSLKNVNGTLFFTSGSELWKSDGTAAGTVLVKAIGSGSSDPTSLTNVNGTLFFVASDDAHGAELWRSDGTAAGTFLLKDVRPGPSSSALAELTRVGRTLFFRANDGASGEELWWSDGTEAGTMLAADLIPGSGGSDPQDLTAVGSSLFFSAIGQGTGRELWLVAPCSGGLDNDGDGIADACDDCPFTPNPGQEDTGGIGAGSAPDGIGDACQCGDVNGDGSVTIADAVFIRRSLLSPPTGTLTKPELCDVGGTAACTLADAVMIQRTLLQPPTATIQQVCAPARP